MDPQTIDTDLRSSTSSNGWSEDADAEMKAMLEKIQGWFWLHSKSATRYSKFSLIITAVPAIITFIVGFFNIREETFVPQVYLGFIELLSGVIIVLRSQLNYHVIHKEHKKAAETLGSLRFRITGELGKKHLSDRENYSEFYASVISDYTDAIYSSVETIPTKFKREYIERANVQHWPEIIIPPRTNTITKEHDGDQDDGRHARSNSIEYNDMPTAVLPNHKQDVRRRAHVISQLATNQRLMRQHQQPLPFMGPVQEQPTALQPTAFSMPPRQQPAIGSYLNTSVPLVPQVVEAPSPHVTLQVRQAPSPQSTASIPETRSDDLDDSVMVLDNSDDANGD